MRTPSRSTEFPGTRRKRARSCAATALLTSIADILNDVGLSRRNEKLGLGSLESVCLPTFTRLLVCDLFLQLDAAEVGWLDVFQGEPPAGHGALQTWLVLREYGTGWDSPG